MLKRICITVIIVLFVAAVVLGFVWSIRARVLAFVLSKQFDAPVKIESVEVQPGQIEIRGFEIYTPWDTQFPKSFIFSYLRVSASLWDLMFSSERKIEEIYVKDVFVGLHLYNALGTQSNWSNIINSMVKESENGVKEGEDEEMAFIIDDLYIDNATLHLKRPGKSLQRFPSIDVHIRDIGSNEPASVTRVIKLVISEVIRQLTLKYGLPKLFKDILRSPKNIIEGVGKIIKKFPVPFVKRNNVDESVEKSQPLEEAPAEQNL